MSGPFTPEHRVEMKIGDGLGIIPAIVEIETCKGNDKLATKFGDELMRVRGEAGAPGFASFADLITVLSSKGFPRYRITFGNRRPRA